MTLLVLDADGVWHEVYNKRVIADVLVRRGWIERDGWIENWEVRTLCSKAEQLGALRAASQRATLDDGEKTGRGPTCVRCMTMPCDHGVMFDDLTAYAQLLTASEIRERWPRLSGQCPKGCGYSGIYYASFGHRVLGGWW